MKRIKYIWLWLTSPMFRVWMKTTTVEEMNNRMLNLIHDSRRHAVCPHIRVGSGSSFPIPDCNCDI